MLSVGKKIRYIGTSLNRLPHGTIGVVRDIMGGPFPYICDFEVDDGEDWPMTAREIEATR